MVVTRPFFTSQKEGLTSPKICSSSSRISANSKFLLLSSELSFCRIVKQLSLSIYAYCKGEMLPSDSRNRRE